MKKCVLGIDLGTSSVKILKRFEDGHIEKTRNKYKKSLPDGWWNAVEDLMKDVNWNEVKAIGLSSQVGTYLINNETVISWNSNVGKKELQNLKEKYTQELFLKEISMPHPDIISYPLPRLKYIKDCLSPIERVCQPKEYILEKLTGEWVTDAYSWRGLVNLEKQEYSEFFLKELGIEKEMLPEIKKFKEWTGFTKEIRIGSAVVPSGIPVFLGLNDFYAGLLGMGIWNTGQLFDLTGTSEHLGILENEIKKDSVLISGPFINEKIHYGVTASSGPSIRFGKKYVLPEIFDIRMLEQEKPPIFLPYLKGERAPIWNPDARGVFFGIEDGCTQEHMAYSVMEGVVFSLYHIYENMGKPAINRIRVSGGATSINCLNQLKAEVFGVPIDIVEENDVSALGACMVGAIGLQWYESFPHIQEAWVKVKQTIVPSKENSEWFAKRFQIYKECYETIKPLYEKWKNY